MADNLRKYTTQEVLNKVYTDSSGDSIGINSSTTKETLNAVFDETDNSLNVALSGGTISGDVTIDGDLTVNGTAGNAYDEIVNGDLHVKSDATNSTSAFLVEQNDGTDVFIVDTANSRVGIGVSSPESNLSFEPALVTASTEGIKFQNAGDDNDAIIQPWRFASGMGMVLGSNFFLNTSGAVARFKDADESVGILLDPRGTFDIYTGASGVDATSKLRINNDGSVGIGGSPHVNSTLNVKNSSGTAFLYITSANDFDSAIVLEEASTAKWIIGNDGNDSDKLKFGTGGGWGTETRMTLDSSGNLGIGEDSPEKPLHIKSTDNQPLRVESTDAYVGIELKDNGSATNPPLISGLSDDFIFYGGSSGTRPTILTLTSSSQSATFAGDVGIGVSPSQPLHIKALHTESGDTDSQIIIEDTTAYNSSPASGIAFRGAFNSGGSVTNLASLKGFKENATDGNFAGGLSFQTRVNGGNMTTALTIDSSQQVGIGETIPDKKLHIKSSTSADGIKIEQSGTGASIVTFFADGSERGFIGVDDSDGNAFLSSTNGLDYVMVMRSAQEIHFGTNGNNTAMVIDNSQNVGIGTTSPSSYNALANNLVVYENSNSGITIGSSTTGTGSLYFADGTTGDEAYKGSIEYSHSSNVLSLRANSVVRFVLDTNSRISLSNNDSGSNNTVFGYKAGNAIASGTEGNVLIGHNTGLVLNGGDANVAIGADALKDGTTGTNNTLIGTSAGANIDSANRNTAVGYQALFSEDSDGDRTLAVGYQALYSQNGDTEAMGNSGLGYNAGFYNITGTLNTWVGYQAGVGASGQSNSQNTGVGYRAGYSITTGSNNTFLGRQTGLVMTSGSDNTFVGMNAGSGNVSGVRSVSIGNQSMLGTVTADGVVAVGYEALKSLTSGAGSVGVGYRAGDAITSGDFNTAIGYGALGLETTGDRNTAVGYNSLANVNGTNNASNTAVGFESGNLISSGFHNVTIGAKAGNVITTGDYNVIIGGESDPSGNNGENQIVVGYGATGIGNNTVTLGNSSVTDVYMAQDSGATVHCDKIQMLNYRIIQKDFGALPSGSSYDIGTANANFAGTIKMWTNHNSGSGYIEYSLVYSTNAKALSLIHQNQPYTPSTVTLSLDTGTGTISTSSLSYNTDVHVVVESLNTQFTFA